MKYWADNGERAGGPWKLNSRRRRRSRWTQAWVLGVPARLLNNAGSSSVAGAASRRGSPRAPPVTHDVWRCINLSARECKEDWFPSRTGAEKRGGIEFRPEFTSEVVFVIFLTYVAVVGRDALADYIY